LTRSAVFFAPLFAVLLALCLSGCGYRFTTGEVAAGGSDAPRTIKLVIGSVDDRSREPLLGAMVRQGLARRGVERSDVAIVTSSSEASDYRYVLTLELKELYESARASTVSAGSREYLLTVAADATVKRGDEVVWIGRNISARREFSRGDVIDDIRFNKEKALKLLADDLAGEAMRRALLGIRKGAKK
jgi:outer membrane lipopolysaccharide assembly protein LptE/RlpB